MDHVPWQTLINSNFFYQATVIRIIDLGVLPTSHTRRRNGGLEDAMLTQFLQEKSEALSLLKVGPVGPGGSLSLMSLGDGTYQIYSNNNII